MDGRIFDDAVRALTRRRGASRRGLLAGLVGAALGMGSFGRAGGRAAAQESGGGEPCGLVVCGAGEFCCNASCSRCVPPGGACTEEDCGHLDGEPCGDTVCAASEFCCNPSCSICAPIGGACTQQACEAPPPAGEPCNGTVCGLDEFCCNWSCSTCAPLGGACTDQFCGDPVCPPGETCCDADCTACCAEPPPPAECRTAADCPPDPTGCNEVGCAGSRCVSTLRACDPAACVGEGEPCGSGVICCDGLVCDGTGAGRRCRASSPAPTPDPSPTAPVPDPRPTSPAGAVRALPNTGAGAGTISGPGGWWPAAWTAVAAGSATLAGRLGR
jgi:hypothetical protein